MAQERFVVRSEEAVEQVQRFSHPWNPNSEPFDTRLSSLFRLSRVGVSRVSVPAGKESSFVYHSHQREEEWIYVLSGHGIAEIGGEEFEVGTGLFMELLTLQVGHHLRNPYNEDLVYLVGGEALDVDIADFPRLGKRKVRRRQEVEIYDASDAKEFGLL